MFEIDNFKVGMVVLFDIGQHTHIGVIKELIHCEDHFDCSIVQPSGTLRMRNLNYDVSNGSIMPLSSDDAMYLNVDIWMKRHQEYIDD